MLTQPTANPYDPSFPTYDPALFFGREDIFAFIRQQLIVEKRSVGIVLIGRQGSGKTSILLQLPNQLDARTLAAFVDLAQVDLSSADDLIRALTDAVRTAFDAAAISTYRLPELPVDLQGPERVAWFEGAFLEVTLSALRGGKRLLFVFDETSALLNAIEATPTLSDFLSAQLTREARIDMIFAVDLLDEPRLETVTPLAGEARHKRIPPLEPEACEALTQVPVESFYRWEEDAVQAALALAGGSPYLLHTLNHLIFERSLARDHADPIMVADLRVVLPEAIADAEPILRPMWEQADPGEQRILVGLSTLTEQSGRRLIRAEELSAWLAHETDAPIDETAFGAALRQLEYRDVVRSHASRRYSLASGLFQQWLLLHAAPPPAPVVNTPATAPVARRWIVPAALALIVLVGGAIAFGRLLIGASEAQTLALTPTVTLPLDLAATQRSINATSTELARPTVTPTLTLTPSATLTLTPSATWTSSPTLTPSETLTLTPSLTLPPSSTLTPSGTLSATFTASNTFTATATDTLTFTPSATPTVSDTPTISPTPSMTSTFELPSTKPLPTAVTPRGPTPAPGTPQP